MASLFINYRQNDEGWVLALDEHLSGRFGSDVVFRDAKSIRAGDDYVRRLLEGVRRASLLLAVIGPNWLDARELDGSRKLERPNDWVRRELAEAFTYGVKVIPILVSGAAAPPEDELPSDIRQLARCQYLSLPKRSRSHDLTRLGDELVALDMDLHALEQRNRPVQPSHRPRPNAVPLTDHRRLVEALAQLPRMRNRSSHLLYLEAAAESLGDEAPADGSYGDEVVLWRLVGLLLARPAALWSFLDFVAADSQRDATELAHVMRIADTLVPRPLLTLEERRNLFRIVGDIEHDNLPEIYGKAFQGNAPLPPSDGVGLQRIIEHLEQLVSSPAFLPPVLRFLEYFAAELDQMTADALRGWIDDAAHRLVLDTDMIYRIRSAARSARISRKYLVIQLQPDGADPKLFLLTVWLQTSSGEDLPLAVLDEPKTLAEIRQFVDDLLSADTTRLLIGGEEELMVEFILPRDLVDHRVERWTFGGRYLPRPLGTEFPVVIRSWERLSDPLLHGRWKRKWETLQNVNGRPVDDVVRILRGGSAERLGGGRDDGRPCLALAYPPAPRAAGDDEDEYAILLVSGTPVALWCREQRDPDLFEAELRGLLAQENVLALRERVLSLRQDAPRDKHDVNSHLGHTLTLFWDDPTRPPQSDMPLRAPA